MDIDEVEVELLARQESLKSMLDMGKIPKSTYDKWTEEINTQLAAARLKKANAGQNEFRLKPAGRAAAPPAPVAQRLQTPPRQQVVPSISPSLAAVVPPGPTGRSPQMPSHSVASPPSVALTGPSGSPPGRPQAPAGGKPSPAGHSLPPPMLSPKFSPQLPPAPPPPIELPPIETYAGPDPSLGVLETFEWHHGGYNVYLVGTFTTVKWDERVPLLPDPNTPRLFKRTMRLPPGVHRFKFVVDGQWCIDILQPNETDAAGNQNNIRVVTTPDGEVPVEAPEILPGLDLEGPRKAAKEIGAIEPGTARPLGASVLPRGEGINFAVRTDERVSSLSLLLYAEDTSADSLDDDVRCPPDYVIDLDPKKHFTEDAAGGGTWHVLCKGVPLPKGKVLLYAYVPSTFKYPVPDPYARLLDTPPASGWGTRRLVSQASGAAPELPVLHPYTSPRCFVEVAGAGSDFDWQGVSAPKIAQKDLVIYEMHVRGFTAADESMKEAKRGTYLGVIERIPHLKDLGVTAIELLPTFEFDETDCAKVHPVTGQQLYNYWGYCTENFFAPMSRFASRRGHAVREFKEMVRELHRAGIQVILDVVYNHASGTSFETLARSQYYILSEGYHCNYTGCGNTVNCNGPVAADMICDSLRHWALEMGVDGFRFDLAPILGRGPDGRPLEEPPVLKRITEEFSTPDLKDKWLIAEPWDADGLMKTGTFWYGARWLEWNDHYRDTMRNFIKGTGANGPMATRLAGSSDLYQLSSVQKKYQEMGQRLQPHSHRDSPLFSVNFVTAHDGFSLRDLVSYDSKHNEMNGENNADGNDQNFSWNCGYEGPVTREALLHVHASQAVGVLTLRERQIKNLLLALAVSRGVPMLLMGDEYGHTKSGNNNTWNQDNELNWFLWDKLAAVRGSKSDVYHFARGVLALRRAHPVLTLNTFFQEATWHGAADPAAPQWGPESKFLACTLKDEASGDRLYVAFNADHVDIAVRLPEGKWRRLVDTGMHSPYDVVPLAEAPAVRAVYEMDANSAIVLAPAK